jgi:outer membrane protein OmpA-like peptidoglycan-associated protein
VTDIHRLFLRHFALLASLALLLSLLSCGRTSSTGNSNVNTAQSNTATVTTTPAANSNESSGDQKAADAELSLVSISAGAIVVKKPEEFDENWSSTWLIDESPAFGWASKKGLISNQVIVIALPELTRLNKLIFDTGSIDGDERGAKDVFVEMSNTSEADGFQKIAEVSLQDKANNQTFPVSAEIPGRWVKLTVKNNHGSPDYVELLDFRATGTQLTHTPLPNISGTYSTNIEDFHIKQEGTSVTGCYERNGGLFEGGINGRVLTITWRQSNGKGPATMVLSPDGKQMNGVYWFEGQPESHGLWYGSRKSDEVGSCAHWAGGIQSQITKDLEELGRARVYGINFDSDSDHIKDESKPTLDKIVSMLKAKPDWKLTIEGHTDSMSTPQHNQDLSERRAASVKNYLQSAGIDPALLKTIGYGATKPVASNDNEMGRAQNRRVELTKQ